MRSTQCLQDGERIMNEQFVANQTRASEVNRSLRVDFTCPLGVKSTQIKAILDNTSVSSRHARFFSVVRCIWVKHLKCRMGLVVVWSGFYKYIYTHIRHSHKHFNWSNRLNLPWLTMFTTANSVFKSQEVWQYEPPVFLILHSLISWTLPLC